MKQNMKRLWIALCMAVCLFALSGCSSKETVAEEIDPMVVMSLQQGTGQYLDLFANMTVEDLENAKTSSEKSKDSVMTSAINSWLSVKSDLGALVSSDTAEIEIVDDGYAARIHAVFEKREADFSVIVNEDLTEISSITITPVYTTGEKLSKAGMNTLMGMGIVFCVLIFISWLISMFKYINVFEENMKKKAAEKAAAAAPAPAPTPAAVTAPAPTPAAAAPAAEEACDDTELISVIAAAIAASEGRETTDGLIVRSIRRVPNRNWK